MPVLPGVLAAIDCSIESVTPAGDHSFVLGRVQHLSANETVGEAMVFYRGKVTGVTPAQ
jgi:flavin reductase (DIM6/NTAB) family NADH-FMN oxidoreductase RutF